MFLGQINKHSLLFNRILQSTQDQLQTSFLSILNIGLFLPILPCFTELNADDVAVYCLERPTDDPTYDPTYDPTLELSIINEVGVLGTLKELEGRSIAEELYCDPLLAVSVGVEVLKIGCLMDSDSLEWYFIGLLAVVGEFGLSVIDLAGFLSEDSKIFHGVITF